MNVTEVMAELEGMGTERYRATMRKHGAPENYYGVKVGDMQKIVKKVKVDQALAEELFATGNGDAMYLAGMIAGIGFTVSLFITNLAFDDPAVVEQAKLGILAASVVAAVVGVVVLSRANEVVEIRMEEAGSSPT